MADVAAVASTATKSQCRVNRDFDHQQNEVKVNTDEGDQGKKNREKKKKREKSETFNAKEVQCKSQKLL